jgi:hypothetical protein
VIKKLHTNAIIVFGVSFFGWMLPSGSWVKLIFWLLLAIGLTHDLWSPLLPS